MSDKKMINECLTLDGHLVEVNVDGVGVGVLGDEADLVDARGHLGDLVTHAAFVYGNL